MDPGIASRHLRDEPAPALNRPVTAWLAHVLDATGGGGHSRGFTFEGALLVDVLTAAEPAFDPDRKNDALQHSVLVTATDNYQAIVAWGEIDPEFEGKEVMLAFAQDGQPLARPRLVVPGDERGGRYVTDVIRVSLLLPQA